MANLCRLHLGQAKLMLPRGGKQPCFRQLKWTRGELKVDLDPGQHGIKWGSGPCWSGPGVDTASSPNYSRRGTWTATPPLRAGQVRIKMQMSYCWNSEWTKCQSIFFDMRYEIDVDGLLNASVIAAEGRLYQQLWYLSCEISLVFFTGTSNSLMSFAEIILKTPTVSTVCLFILYQCQDFLKTNHEKEQYRTQVGLFSIIDKNLPALNIQRASLIQGAHLSEGKEPS